jgi:hypothetical protein
VGIALGMLFAPVIYLLLATIQTPTIFSNWFWSLAHGDFTTFLTSWVNAGYQSMEAPIVSSVIFPNSLISGFGPGSLLASWLPTYLAGIITWMIVGVWAGAIERSAGRGIGVGVGIWLGWLIIEIIYFLVVGAFALFFESLLADLLTVIVVIVVAAIFGAMTRSEEI